MIVPPVTIMPLVPMTARRIGIAGPIIPVPFREVGWWFARHQLRSRGRVVSCDVTFGVYRCEHSILSSDGRTFTHCGQSPQFPLARHWINRDRFLPVNASDPLRVNRWNITIR
jgi:hypothetical protein